MWDWRWRRRRSTAVKRGGAGSGVGVVWLLIAAACGAPEVRAQRQAEEPPPAGTVATRPVASTSASASTTAPSAVPVAAPSDAKSPSAVAAHLVSEWCSTTGDEKKPPCSVVTFDVLEERKAGGIETAVLRVTAAETPIEERQFLYLRRGERVAVAPLAVAMSSGVGGFSHEITIGKISMADRTGDTEPEWSAEVEIDVHDSDMGLCRLTGTLDRQLVVCGSTPEGFECAKTPLVRSTYEEQGDAAASDCGKPKSKNRGFFLVAEHGDKDVTLRAAAGDRPITTPVRPPLVGTLTITKLMKSAALPLRSF